MSPAAPTSATATASVTRGLRREAGAQDEARDLRQDPAPGAARRPMVTPFARSLALLGAFAPQNDGLGNNDLAARTGIPASTVSRMAQALVSLGYLHYAAAERKYRLTAAALGLGYAASANSDVQHTARPYMQAFAEQHKVHVSLSTRDRLEVIVLDSWISRASPLALNLHVGVRVGIAASPMGWALLAALPDIERFYLMENVERRMPREWRRLRRRSSEAISEVHEKGFCSSLGEWHDELGIVATPLLLEDRAPLVLACVGASSQLTRSRVERELGPRLRGMARAIQEAGVPK